jgi:hypothetical protein
MAAAAKGQTNSHASYLPGLRLLASWVAVALKNSQHGGPLLTWSFLRESTMFPRS